MTASLLATAAVGSLAQTFDGLPPDVDPDGPFAEAVEWAVDEDLTRPFPDGEFKGTRDITRAALATWYYRLAGEPEGPFEEPAATDVDEDTNFYTEISWALENGVMNVFPDGNFNPNRPTVRQAAAAITFQNAGSPEGDFAQLAIEAFPDVDEDTTFANEIGWLVANGYTEAFDDGEWKPNRDVSRFAMAAWFFRIYAEVEVPVEALRVVAADTGDDLVYLSDGEAVTEYEYTDDSFEINGTPSSIGAFENFLGNAPDVLIETRVEGDDVIHNVTRGELVTAGVIGNSPGLDEERGAIIDGLGGIDADDQAGSGLAIVDLPSGVALTDITATLAGIDEEADLDVTYTLGGTAVGEVTFFANVGVGDFIEVDVLDADDDGIPTSVRHNLTNGELTGTVAALLGGEGTTLVVDAVAGDDADVTTYPLTPHYTFDIADADDVVFLVDGEEEDAEGDDWTAATWLDEAEDGAAVSYSRAAGVQTFDVASTEAVQEIIEGVVVGDGLDATPLNSESANVLTDVLLLVDDGEGDLEPSERVEFEVGETDSITIDGVVSTLDELQETLSAGDSVVYGVPDDDFDAFIEVTTGTITDAQVIDFEAPLLTVVVPGSTFELGVDATADVYGFDDGVGYTIDGNESYLDDDGDPVLVETFIVNLLGSVNFAVTSVSVSLVDDDGTAVWDFSGFTA
ncbi:MAG: S-layer homology domain-containing protein, partial [Nitriliruptor sp.]